MLIAVSIINDEVYKDVVIKKLAIFTVCLLLSLKAIGSEVSAITHPSVEKAAYSKLELRRIFSKRVTKWPNGQPIVVFVLESSHPLHKRFSKEVLKIFPYQLDRIWNKMMFSGVGTAPIVVKDYETLLKEVSKTPGAIGYGENITQEGGLHVVEIKE